MSRDAVDELATRLFEAAREEPLPNGAVERALLAAKQARAEQPAPTLLSPRHLGAGGFWLAVAAIVTLALWRWQTPEHLTGISAEPTTAADKQLLPKPEPPKAASAEPTRVSAPSSTLAPLPVRSTAATGSVRHATGASTLGDELEALKRAETALGTGDAKGALDALDRYDHELHGHELRAEAALLRMDALKRQGHAEQAAALAARFVAENPGSPLVDRARSFMSKPSAPAPSALAPKPELP